MRLALPVLVLAGCLKLAPQPLAKTGAPTARPSADPRDTAPCQAPQGRAGRWRHEASAMLRSGSPHHGVVDAVVRLGSPAPFVAKFAYGSLSKDLEDEAVQLFVVDAPGAEPCRSWRPLGRAITDSDGYVRTSMAAARFPAAGPYPVLWLVDGDGSSAEGLLWVVEEKQKVVIFDVDGTLTEGDEVLFEQLLSGQSPAPRAGAVKVARHFAESGHLVIYITGRPSILASLTRRWLDDSGFPSGPLLTTEHLEASMPTADGVQAFKREALLALKRDARVEIVRAYGNAPTDACAYAEAGIAPSSTFMVGPHAGIACTGHEPTQPVHSYESHFDSLEPSSD